MMVNNIPAIQKTQVLSLGGERFHGKGNGYSLQYFLSGEFYGQRSLVGCSPRSRMELDMTEQPTLLLFH